MRAAAVLLVVIALPGLAQDDKPSPVPSHSRKASKVTSTSANPDFKIGAAETGEAVYFSNSRNGRKAASGEELDSDSLTGAHALYPFGSIIRVTNLGNNRTVEVRVVDRISSSSNKVVSVSRSAAEQLEFLRAGSAQVKVELVALAAGR